MIATALSLASCHSVHGLEVFKEVTKSSLKIALKLIDQKQITLTIADTEEKILVDARVTDGKKWGHALIVGRHDQFVLLENYEGVSFTKRSRTSKNTQTVRFSRPKIIDTVESLPFEDVTF